jgi:putative phage-type endonuclease
MPMITSTQGTPEWLAARIGSITASTAAAALGLHPHMSRAAAWRAIRGEVKAENPMMQWGKQWEPAARSDYEVETGRLVTETGLWVHPTLPWLMASADGLVGDEGAIEIKCGNKLPEKCPVYHRIQCLVVMFVTDRQWVDYYCFHPANGHYLERIHRQGEKGLLRRLEAFWREYVFAAKEPERKKPRRRKKAA